jgi:hypothetical protein
LAKKLADFNKVLFKKDVSPYKKWAYLEALATWVKVGDLMLWMSECPPLLALILQHSMIRLTTRIQ